MQIFPMIFHIDSFGRWVNENYNPGILRLVTDWVDHMENKGEVLHWYPFLDPMEDLAS